MPIEDFLVDFYSKNTDQEIDQVKIDSIVDYYGGDNVSMINDLYEKYDTGNINDDKVLEIKEYYSLDLPKQGEVVEETTIQETEVEEKEPVVEEEKKDNSNSFTDNQIKRFNKGEFLTAEKDLFNEYVKPENKESRKKKLADETFQQLETYIKDIPVESIEKELANDYFKVPDLEEMKSRFEQGRFLMSEKEAMAAWEETGDIPLDIYISDPEKQKQYKSYIQSGVLEPYSDQNEAELYSLEKQSKNNLYKKEAELYLRNVPEDVQDLMLPFGSNKEYKTSEEAVKALDVTRQALVDNSNQIKKDYSSYFEEAKPYNDRIKEIKKEIGDIESTIKSGNINDGSPEAKEAYLGLLNEAELIQEDYTKKGIDKLYNNIVEFQELNNLNIKAFEEKAENVETKSILEKAIGLDYTLSARAGTAMEEFFVGGALNFGSLTSQVLLKAAGASRGSTKLLQPYIDVIKQSTVNYNKKLAEKRETTIPEAISLDDIENGNIDFFDWFGESLANNSPSIVTTFIPGSAVLRGSSLVRGAVAKGISKKAALQAQQRLIKQGTRTAQAIFFTGESGGRYGDLEVQQSNALERLPMLKKQIEEELNTDKKIELQEEYEDLKRISDYSFAQKAFTSYAYGGIATAAETLGSLKLITGGNKLAKEIGKQNFKAGIYGSKLNFAANVTGKTISGISKSAGKAIAVEELEEGLTLIGHNLVDIAVLGENKSVIEGLNKDFLANTAVTSFAIMAPKTMGNTRNMLKSEFSIREDLKETEKKTLELIQLQEQFSALDPGIERDELRNRRRQLLNELALDDAISLNNLNYLSNEQIVEVSDINRQMRQFQNQMIELGKTGDLSEGGIQARKRIQDQYTALDDKRTDLLNTKKLKIREDKKKIAESLGSNFVNLRAEYYLGLNDFYSDVAMTLMPKDGKYIAVETSENGDITTDLSELSKEEVEAVNNFVASGQNATIFGNNILVNNTIVKKQIGASEYFGDAGYAAAAPIEELFHLQNKAKNIVDKDGLLSEEATKAVDEAIEFIGNKKELGLISEEDYNDLIKRFELYKTGGKGKVILKSGKRGNATVDAEELLAQMNNAVALGALTLDDVDNMPSLKGFINDLGKDIFGDSSWMFDLKTSDDVFKFIKNYQSNIQENISLALPDDEDKTVEKFSKSEVTELAKQYKKDPNKTDVEELIKQYDNVALKALGYDISKGTIAPEEAISFVDKEFNSILRRYDGSTEFSTWINSNIRPKRQAFYEEQIGKESETTSIDSEQARQVVDDSETTADDRTEKEIRQSERKTKVAKRLKLEDKAIREVASKIENIDLSKVNYKTLKNLANETIGEAFGISPNKILSNANLTKSEIANAQRYIKNNVDLLKALLPDGYNKDFKSTGVPKVLLDKFYNKRSVRSKTVAGLNVQNKKPNIGSVEFLEVFGFVEGKPTRDDRNISARIIALANQAGKAITNQTVREQLQKDGMPESALKNIKSGTPSGLFNKASKIPKIKNLKEDIAAKLKQIARLRSKNDIGKYLSFDTKAINEKTRLDLQLTMQEAAELGLIDTAVVEAGMMASGGRYTFYGDENNKYQNNTEAISSGIKRPNKYIKRINGEYVLFAEAKKDNPVRTSDYIRSEEIKNNLKSIEDQIDEDGLNPFVAKQGRLYYSKKDPAYKKLIKSVEKYEGEKAKRIKPPENGKITKEFLEAKKNQSEINMKVLNHVVNKLTNAVQKGMPMEVAGLVIVQSYQASSGLIKIAAPFKYVSKKFEYGLKKDGIKKYREEHNPPASVVGASILWGIKNNASELVMEAVNKNYYQTILSKADDSKLDLAKLDSFLPEGISIFDNPAIRIAEAGINLNTLLNPTTGKTMAEENNLAVPVEFENDANVSAEQNRLLIEKIKNGLDSKFAKQELNEFLKLAKSKIPATNNNKLILKNSKVLDLAGNLSIKELLGKAASIDEALKIARDINASVKKIRVFDFDDTLATTKSDVLFTAPDGTEGKLNAEEFATKGKELLDEGYVFDFSEFNKVTKGKPGPLIDLAKKIQDARGTEDVFILTARAPQAAVAIKEFLYSQGLDIPLKNITGLGKSTGEAKANWMIDKAAEGYNDFYFADDALQNVKAVKDVMSVVDVKSKVQQAKFSKSKDLSSDFNKLIEESTGIGAEKVFSDVKAKLRGGDKKGQRFFIPSSAEDMLGLVYTTLGKGKKGEAHMKFYQDALLDPYARAMENLSTDRVNLMADFKALKKQLDVPKDLRKTTESGFTNEQAVRTYLWNKAGQEIPGLSKTDMKELSDLVENNPKLKVFADQIMSITKGDGYSTPTKNWASGTITTDLIDVLNTTKRAKYLETWNQNKDVIFSKDNLNKLEAAYGTKYKESMENILTRMKSGRNRIEGGNVLSNKVLDYINNSTGAIMFFNTRSAVLQTISAANFVNWGFNNPLRAGAAFANQPQYWKDFTKLINSDYLKDRRNGLKLNISESEIADAAKTSTNKAKAGLNYILEKGYAPTKFADSFAIASGGATFYRNRIKDLIRNEGKTEKEAEAIAMREFREVSEISQQSSDPSKTSSQQASTLGRVVLQFANTPMQYARIQKRAVQDIVNGRGDLKTNISKIAYYGFLQNMLFNSLQQGLFALGFGDDEIDEKEEQKIIKMANGMVDSSLRGLGFAGVTIQVLKNLGIDLYDRSKRDRPEYSDSYIKLLDFSPAVKSKLTKFRGAAYPFDSKKRRAEVFEKGFSLNNPAYESMAKVVTATTNLPLDRLYSKVNNLSAAMDDETETWQSIAMVLGWPEWQIKGRQNYVEAPKTKEEKIKIKEERSKTRIKEAKGSTDFKTLKKLNKSEQLRILKNLGVGGYNLKKYKKLKEADLIEEIIKRNKKKEQ